VVSFVFCMCVSRSPRGDFLGKFEVYEFELFTICKQLKFAVELVTICHQLKLATSDDKKYETGCLLDGDEGQSTE